MKKKLMTLQQHRLLKEAGQLIAFSERLKHAQKETTDRNWKEREEQLRRSAKAASTVTALSGDIEEFLTSRYDFRYNLLTNILIYASEPFIFSTFARFFISERPGSSNRLT